jgi:LuxR family maltose regulon positive regulatory protein
VAPEVAVASSIDLTLAEAAVAEARGDVATLLAGVDRLLTAPGLRAGPATLRAHAWRVRGLAWSGDADGAAAAVIALDRAAAVVDVGSAALATDLALARGWAAWAADDMFTLGTHVAAAAEQVAEREPGARTAERALLAGIVHRERDQAARAMTLLREAASLAPANGHTVVAALAGSELARCHRAAGAALEALEVIVPLRVSCGELPPAVDAHLRATEVRLRLDRNDAPGACAVAQAAPPGTARELLLARIAVHQAPSRARELVDRIVPSGRRQAVEQLLLRAQLPDVAPAEATAALSEAATIGEPLGLVRTFLDDAEPLSRALAALATETDDRAVGRITALARQELAMAPAPAAAPLIEQLTSRELAVLRLLPLRLSNREMAAQMYISINTLKTHVRAIYRKLEVPDRSSAVRRAKALELV